MRILLTAILVGLLAVTGGAFADSSEKLDSDILQATDVASDTHTLVPEQENAPAAPINSDSLWHQRYTPASSALQAYAFEIEYSPPRPIQHCYFIQRGTTKEPALTTV